MGVTDRPTDRAGTTLTELGSYRLIERLGDGGMGAIYRAVHKRLGRTVAIKVLHRQLCADRGIINRFFHEARAANTIRHPHVIEVYDFVDAGADVYFVMELLQGEDLHDAIHHGRSSLTIERSAAILMQVAAALEATHARGIVHRDLKPENVFLSRREGRDDYVKIFDFGVAKLDRLDGRSTVEGALLGTPEYMAPEQVRGDKIDGRADVYALGCVAYEMLTRRQAFGGGAQAEILARHIAGVPILPRAIEPAIPVELERVLLDALAVDVAARPATARIFAERVAAATGVRLDPTLFHPHDPAAATPAPLPVTPSQALALRTRGERMARPAMLVAIALTAIIGIATVTSQRAVSRKATATTTAVAETGGFPAATGGSAAVPVAAKGTGNLGTVSATPAPDRPHAQRAARLRARAETSNGHDSQRSHGVRSSAVTINPFVSPRPGRPDVHPDLALSAGRHR